jgi:hypothetical protein
VGVACEGCPPLADLVKRYDVAGGKYFVCPICFDARHLDKASLIAGAELQGHRADVGLDRRRGCNHLQLLGTPRAAGPGRHEKSGRLSPSAAVTGILRCG